MTNKHPLFNINNLLSILIGVGTITLGLFAFDAERVIGRVDQLTATTAEIHETTSLLDGKVTSLNSRVDGFGNILTEHEKRISSIEGRHDR